MSLRTDVEAPMVTPERLELVRAAVPESYKGQHDMTHLKVTAHGQNAFTIEKMYEYATVNFAFLSRLAEIFGTKNIDTDQSSSSGCETCDYGSNYVVTFTVLPESAE